MNKLIFRSASVITILVGFILSVHIGCSGPNFSVCQRHPVNYVFICDELVKINGCWKLESSSCYNYSEVEYVVFKEQFVYNGSGTTTIGVAEQEDLFNQCLATANQNRPLCSNGTSKKVINLDFTQNCGLIVSTPVSEVIGGFVATYACCEKKKEHN